MNLEKSVQTGSGVHWMFSKSKTVDSVCIHSSSRLLYLIIGVLDSGRGVWLKENIFFLCRHHSSSCQMTSRGLGLGSAATTRPAAHSLRLCSGESLTNVSFCSWSSFCSQHAEPGQQQQPCLPFEKESPSCKVNFWQELTQSNLAGMEEEGKKGSRAA